MDSIVGGTNKRNEPRYSMRFQTIDRQKQEGEQNNRHQAHKPGVLFHRLTAAVFTLDL